ncbi:MAG: AarF/ABC1/UbiB kinase family protein [Gaiellaceae bacterium]
MASRSRASNLGRLSEIAQVAVRHGFGYLLTRHHLSDLIPGRRRLRLEEAVGSERGRHLRAMLEDLGPTFVKFGQLLSMRPDILPPDVIAELRGLQDDVRPFAFSDAQRVIEQDLDQSLERLFLEFDETPIAAASIGQVHRAVLPNGHVVAVKVQRPGAPEQIEADLALLYQLARIIKERVRALDFVDVRAIVDEFANSIRRELDYHQEGRNADMLRRQFAADPHVRVPHVYWTYTRSHVLTLEFLDGTKLAELDEELSRDDRRRLATRVAKTWMEMIFKHGVFHGDPHPANVFVLGSPDEIGLVDFGLVGRLSDEDMGRLTRLFIDAATENVDALPQRLYDLGVRCPPDREQEFALELHEGYYRYHGASLAEIDPLQVIREVFSMIYSLNLRLPTRFLILDKALATLAAVGVELTPDFNVFEIARPYARDLVRDRFSPERMLRRARRDGVELVRVGRELPSLLHGVMSQTREGRLEIGFVHKGLEDAIHQVSVAFNRLVIALIVAGGLIGSSLIGIFAHAGPKLLGVNVISVAGFLLAGVLGVWLLWGVIRSGRL